MQDYQCQNPDRPFEPGFHRDPVKRIQPDLKLQLGSDLEMSNSLVSDAIGLIQSAASAFRGAWSFCLSRCLVLCAGAARKRKGRDCGRTEGRKRNPPESFESSSSTFCSWRRLCHCSQGWSSSVSSICRSGCLTAELGARGTRGRLRGRAIGDFFSYWRHRLEHTRLLWPAHAIHHSDTDLTWLTIGRFHPIDRVVTCTVDIALLALLGFPGLGAGIERDRSPLLRRVHPRGFALDLRPARQSLRVTRDAPLASRACSRGCWKQFRDGLFRVRSGVQDLPRAGPMHGGAGCH